LTFEPIRKHKSELYQDPLLPLLSSRRIALLRHQRAINQICSLERSTARSGRDQISRPSHGHDDLSNAIAGAADLALNYTLFDSSLSWVDGAPANETYAQRKQRESDENFRWRLGNYMRSIGAVW
jgi:hypothetical protein